MSETSVSYGTALKWGVISVVITLIINLGLFFIGTSQDAFGDGIAETMGMAMSATLIVTTVIFLQLGGSLFYGFFSARNPETGKRNFAILGGIVYLFFLGGPFFLLENTVTLSVVLLEIMHIVTAGTLTYILFTRAE